MVYVATVTQLSRIVGTAGKQCWTGAFESLGSAAGLGTRRRVGDAQAYRVL